MTTNSKRGARLPLALLLTLSALLPLSTLPLTALPLCQSQSEQRKFWGGTLMQILSMHTGASIDAGSPSIRAREAKHPATRSFQPLLGVSAGVVYMNPEDDRELDYGWRLRYLFSSSLYARHDSHDIGLLLYLHPFPNPYHRASGAIQTHLDCEGLPDGYPTPFSLIFASGLLVQNNETRRHIGGYVEGGISLLKWLPVNIDLLYRLSFYPNSPFYPELTSHSVQIVFTIL